MASPIPDLRPTQIRVGLGETVVCTITNTLTPGRLSVTKSAPTIAHDGDTIVYGIRVSNGGSVPLGNVTLTERIGATGSACQGGAPVFTGGDANFNGVLETTETWTYSCTYVVQHADEDETRHIVNVVSVTATDPSGRTVGPVDASATTLITHPALALRKTAPASVRPGDLVPFDLAVSNPGDTSFAESAIDVADPACTAPPSRVSTANDPTPDSLDPGDTWTYRCSVQTASSDTVLRNTAAVQATDRFGTDVSAVSSFTVALSGAPPPTREKPRGGATLTGRTGCAFKSFLATVRGTRIDRVVFSLDGNPIRWYTNTQDRKVVRLRINPAWHSNGTHRLVAKVTFTAGTTPPRKTLRLTFQVCKKKRVEPRFTG